MTSQADIQTNTQIKPIHRTQYDRTQYDWAQIALVNEINWCIIGPYIQATGLLDTLSFENVQCPVVLTTDIPRITKTRIFKQYVAFSGVSNIDGMISDLVEAGGVVSYP